MESVVQARVEEFTWVFVLFCLTVCHLLKDAVGSSGKECSSQQISSLIRQCFCLEERFMGDGDYNERPAPKWTIQECSV